MAQQTFQRPFFLGIDIGGTGIKIGVVDDNGQMLGHTKIATENQKGAPDAAGRVRIAADKLLTELGLTLADITAAGVGAPGTMDIPNGKMLEPHNLPGWYNAPIRNLISEALDGKRVSFANDANAAAFGEWWVGTGKNFNSIVLLTLGTGVGGGIIIGDLSVDGENSAGSECGHMIVDSSPNARMCPCGKRGHLEAYCSATALVKRTKELLMQGRPSSLSARVTEKTPLTALMVDEEAEKGDALANEVIDDFGHWLGVGIVSIMYCIDPGVVILGGAVNFGGEESKIGKRFLERIRTFIKENAFPIPAARTTVSFAALGGDAGLIGAAGIARTDFHKRRHA